jgi:PIN domain nuclease of toxin-antitoxin system
MAVLLDTHIIFWALRDAASLSRVHRSLIADRTRPIYVSAVTGWEIAIKVKLGKWPEAASLVPNLTPIILRDGYQPLDITLTQPERAGSLELVHRDPFDRLLAAQALDLGIPIATVDPAMATLGCRTI